MKSNPLPIIATAPHAEAGSPSPSEPRTLSCTEGAASHGTDAIPGPPFSNLRPHPDLGRFRLCPTYTESLNNLLDALSMTIKYKYNTLEDFLISHPLNIDVELDDGWGAKFPVKGIELDATVLFADISGFTRRTNDLSSTETLIFVNNFFSWITAEAFLETPCIVDKYIGDEAMLLFSERFGSEDPFVDAVRTARWMGEKDVLAFCPHIGIASGTVTAGYVGTPIKYSASLFGKPVNVASRCASIRPQGRYSSSMTFPADEWKDRDVDEVLPPEKYPHPEKGQIEKPLAWEILEPRTVAMKNMGEIEVRELANSAYWFPQQSAEERAKESFEIIAKNGGYRK